MSGADGAADLLVVGAPVYTADPARRWAGAVAVRDGRVAAVGAERDIAALRGPATRVLRLRGGLVLPGFHDAHVHPSIGGLELLACDLHEVEPAGYPAAVARYAADHPDAPWVTGGGWVMDAFPGGTPHRAALDAVVGDRPVFLASTDGHSAWVNSRALAVAGVTAATPDPPRGRIERDAAGEPTGALHEEAMNLVGDLVPDPGPAQREAGIELGQAHLHRLGVTAWQDALVSPETLAAYRAVAERGALTGRVVAAVKWEVADGDAQLATLPELTRTHTVGRLRATAVKHFQDGVFENRTAAMLDPYLDGDGAPTGNHGIGMLPPDELARVVTALDRAGFDVHVHAIGDRAVREALDAFELAAARNGPSTMRHHIAHLQVVGPADVPRFGALGVVANCQPFWACLDDQMRDLNAPILGPERVATQYPFRSLHRAGARLAFGSDWSVTTPDPLAIVQVAVTRVPFDEPDVEPFLPDERLDLDAALEAATAGSAFVNHLDELTGAIRPGMAADLAVVDRDIFAVAPMEIGRARVDLTLARGAPVFDRHGELR